MRAIVPGEHGLQRRVQRHSADNTSISEWPGKLTLGSYTDCAAAASNHSYLQQAKLALMLSLQPEHVKLQTLI